MTWAPLLLADPSPSLRLLVLRELLGHSEDDPEVDELKALRATDPLVTDLLALQDSDGSWKQIDGAGATPGDRVRTTSQALWRLGYLGLGPDDPHVRRAAEHLFSRQRKDGAWPLPRRRPDDEGSEGYDMIPLQTALPLKGLAACGYATDPRAERAYDWLEAQRLADGSWPTGTASGNYGRVAGYRRLAHSRWGCRSNTTGSLSCLALHPERSGSEQARRALDLLLGRETRERHAFGHEVARTVGAERARGFMTYYARFDLAHVLDLSWRIGATTGDERVADVVEFVVGLQGPYGLWEHATRPQVSRWLTFDVLRSLSRLDEDGEWLSTEPRTPFRTYPPVGRRY